MKGVSLLAPPIAVSEIHDEYARRGLDRVSDVRLVAEVGAVLTRPRRAPADSFVLHAPLELAARAALLPWVRPDRREDARLRLVALAAGFEAFGEPVAEPSPEHFPSNEAAALQLAGAVQSGDLDAVDVAARWLGRAAKPAELRVLLADAVVPRLSAAAHAPIFLYHLPRVAPRGEISGELLRGLSRELARAPDWCLHWIDVPHAGVTTDARGVFDAIAATPSVGDGSTFFIYPLMALVDAPEHPVAADVLGEVVGGIDIEARGRMLLRIAAWSMLEEPPTHAPYGWSHCLTMPQAVLGIADACDDPSHALAVAATYIVGFRGGLAERPLVAGFDPADPAVDAVAALASDPATAAAAVHHADEDALGGIITELATRASVQRDAHLVKYTLACFDAAHDDPTEQRLFLAAAASLVAWWAQAGDPDDPLTGGASPDGADVTGPT